jgi:hypothetical protein
MTHAITPARSPGILSDLHRRLLDAGGGHVLLHLPGGPIRQQGALHAQLQHLHMKDGNGHFLVATPANTGLRRNDPAADGGVGDVTLPDADLGSFKSPSLRNVDVTAPYGHDGGFATLEALMTRHR